MKTPIIVTLRKSKNEQIMVVATDWGNNSVVYDKNIEFIDKASYDKLIKEFDELENKYLELRSER